ncbi:hypothetical protein [Burkholderia pseudomallei]|uniref:hypothetical protein n=1 Tax=Burkholderia pseudomallei TaxID=28450 RepID=UPI000F088097|nr:hypothetical protein [Burkholderia pseudomallei]MBO7832532.1 hypothetical protein [Burkholderia pseudomallei]MBO7850981.1 hypothetical protein [Burkholderia pseudomallei]VBE31078.1 Uncharacterised protein [Burkholderia pseudomallei]
MNAKKTPDDNLLDAQLDFIMNAPQAQFDQYLAESGIDINDFSRRSTLAFDQALKTHASASQAIEALANLSPAQQKALAESLRIRRSVLAALREHRVIVASIPKRFLSRLADLLGQTIGAVTAALAVPAPRLAGQYKSDDKPDAATARVTFEQLLRDAAMSEEEIEALMRDGD